MGVIYYAHEFIEAGACWSRKKVEKVVGAGVTPAKINHLRKTCLYDEDAAWALTVTLSDSGLAELGRRLLDVSHEPEDVLHAGCRCAQALKKTFGRVQRWSVAFWMEDEYIINGQDERDGSEDVIGILLDLHAEGYGLRAEDDEDPEGLDDPDSWVNADDDIAKRMREIF